MKLFNKVKSSKINVHTIKQYFVYVSTSTYVRTYYIHLDLLLCTHMRISVRSAQQIGLND